MISPQRIAPNPETHAGVGEPLPYLELLPLTGGQPPVGRQDLAGHVTLLNFWGTWCPPCRAELPHMAELRERYAGREAFRLLAVSCPAAGEPDDVQSLREDTEALLKRLHLDLPTYYDRRAANANRARPPDPLKRLLPTHRAAGPQGRDPRRLGRAIGRVPRRKWSGISAWCWRRKERTGRMTPRRRRGHERTRIKPRMNTDEHGKEER